MAKYTVRTEQVDGGWVAWVDQDNKICIRQENEPGLTGFFASESDAHTWGVGHATQLEEIYDAGVAAEALKKEREEAAHQANLAMVAILQRLTNPTA